MKIMLKKGKKRKRKKILKLYAASRYAVNSKLKTAYTGNTTDF